MSSNMRQRVGGKSTAAGSSPAIIEKSSWEISSDHGDENESSNVIPMYNPLHYHHPSSSSATGSTSPHNLQQHQQQYHPHHHNYPPSSGDNGIPALGGSTGGQPPPSSNPSWDAVMEAKRKNERMMGGGGGGGSVASSLGAPSSSSSIASSSLNISSKNKYHHHHTSSSTYIGMKGSMNNPLMFPSTMSQPRFIADKDYQAYIQGRLGKSTRQPAMNKLCMARFCASFSMVAFMIMFGIGVLIDRQPLYIAGVLPQHVQYTTGDKKQQIFYAIPTNDRLDPASNAYWSALLYLLTATLCYGYVHNAQWWIKRWWLQHQGKPYRDIPDVYSDHGDNDDHGMIDDTRSTIPTFHNGGGGGMGMMKKNGSGGSMDSLPMYGDNTTNSSRKKRAEAFQTDNPLLARAWQTTSSATQRLSLYVSSAWADSQDRRRNKRRFAGAKDV